MPWRSPSAPRLASTGSDYAGLGAELNKQVPEGFLEMESVSYSPDGHELVLDEEEFNDLRDMNTLLHADFSPDPNFKVALQPVRSLLRTRPRGLHTTGGGVPLPDVCQSRRVPPRGRRQWCAGRSGPGTSCRQSGRPTFGIVGIRLALAVGGCSTLET